MCTDTPQPPAAPAGTPPNPPISVLFAMDAMHGGGAEKVLADLLKHLDREKIRPALFVFTRCGAYLENLPPDVPVFALFEDPERFRGPQRFLRLAARSIFIRAAKRLPALMRLAARRAGLPRNFEVGVSFCEGMNLLLLSGAPRRFRKKIAWVHTNMARHKYALGKADFSRAARAMDKIVFVAKSALAVFQEIFPEIPPRKLVQIYNPVDVDGIREKAGIDTAGKPPQNRPFQILAVGRLEEVKRFDRLLDAFKLVLGQSVDARLVILGSGGKLAALREHAHKAGVAGNVEFVPFLENPYERMARADILVSSSDYEGLPIVITEAMSLGLPVVATRTTGAGEILNARGGPYGILTDFTPESLAEGISAMRESRTLTRFRNSLDAARRGGFFPFGSSTAEIERLLLGLGSGA
ncbi:MAG: glycosyltransferase [Puniceicoccales bacterium]|nr:glycosyltransferase [Puniceicoccales bacterium]